MKRNRRKWREIYRNAAGNMATRKHTPIPGLAEHIAVFSRPERKRATAAFLARMADRLYALSEPATNERL